MNRIWKTGALTLCFGAAVVVGVRAADRPDIPAATLEALATEDPLPLHNMTPTLAVRWEAARQDLEAGFREELATLIEAHREAPAADRPALEAQIRRRKLQHAADMLQLQVDERARSLEIGEFEAGNTEIDEKLRIALEHALKAAER